MGIENFDHGARVAAAQLTVGTDAASSSCRAIGIAGMQVQGTGVALVDLVEPVGQEEFFATATRNGDADDHGEVAIEWFSDTRFRVTIMNATPVTVSGSCFVEIYQLANAGQVVPTDA